MSAPAVQVEAKQNAILPSKNLFFKTLINVQLGNEEATSDNSDAFSSPAQGLACSNKHGSILAAFQNSFIVFRTEDVWQAQLRADNENSKKVSLSQLPHMQVRNNAIISTPTIVSLSIGEEYLAVNTNKNGCAFVIIFKLAAFLSQKGTCKPFCEIRGSGNPGAQIRSICWNPGENLNNVVAICCTDGSLILTRIVSENTMENWVLNEGVQTICWSPKGKQLVAGKSDGNFSQLKMDLTEAKKIPGPGGKISTSIFWNSTTQFVVLFDTSSEISVMVLDLVKGGPAHYSNFEDVFVSDTVSYTTQCFFIPVNEWKCIISTTNSSSEIVLFGKSQENEPWALLDIPDHKRATLPLDNYALGASIYLAQSHNVVISDSEQYPPMPILYVLSQMGTLYSYFLVNSDPAAPKIVTQVTDPIPNTHFLSQSQPQPQQIPQPLSLSTPVAPAPASLGEVKLPTAPMTFTPQGTPPSLQFASNTVPPNQRFASPQSFTLGNSPSQPLQLMSNINLPTKQELKEVKSVLSDRILEASPSSNEAHEYQNLLIDIQKFEKRLSNFKQMQIAELSKIEDRLQKSIKYFDENIVEDLKTAENFVRDIEDTTNGQLEEVEILKERMLYQFSHLEHAKSMMERTKDLRYMQLLRSQPMDPSTLEKFQKIETMYKYVRNQIKEAERHFLYKKPGVGVHVPQQRTAQFIYQTIANHSQIIRNLSHEAKTLRSVLQMSKNYSFNESASNRSKLDTDEEIELSSLSISDCKSPKSNTQRDTASLEELIFGIRGVTLDKDSDDLMNKPILVPNYKWEEIRNSCSRIVEVDCVMNMSSALNLRESIDLDNYKSAFKDEVEAVKAVKSEQTFLPQPSTFSVTSSPSMFTEAQKPMTNFSTTTKQFQSGDGSFNVAEKSIPAPATKDLSFKLPMPLKSFGSPSDTFKFSTGDNISISGGNLTSSINKESFSTPFFSVPELSTPFVVSSSKAEEALPAPKFPAPTASSGSIFGLSSLSSSPSSGTMGGSIFGGSGGGGLFGSAGSIVLGGVPPSVTVKSAVTPPLGPTLQLSSSSSSTSDESSGEQKPPATSMQPVTILSTPKPAANVGLWGVSSGSFTGQPQDTKPQPSTLQQLKLQTPHPPNVSVAATSSVLNTFQTVPVPLKNSSSLFSTTPVQQKPTSPSVSVASSLSSILSTALTSPSDASKTLEVSSFSGGSTSTETSSPKPVVAAVTSLPPNRSIFGGMSASLTQTTEQTPSSTIGTTPSLLTSSLSGSGMTSIFASPPPLTTEKKEGQGLFSLTGGLGSGTGFGLLGSTPTSVSTTSTLPATTTSSSLFGGSFQATPTTTGAKTINFSTSGLFGSGTVTKTDEDNLGGVAGTVNVSLPAASSTQTPPQSPSTGLFRSAELTTPSAAQTTTPSTATTTASSIFATPPPSVFSGASFGGITPTTGTTAPATTASVFGTPTTSSFGGSVFGAVATSAAAPSSAFGTPAAPTPIQSPFGGGSATSPTTSFGGVTTTTNPATSPFSSAVSNANITSPFGGSTNVTATSPFGGGTPVTGIAAPASIFGGSTGAASPTSAFGGTSNTSSTPSASIFGQSQPASVFGGSGSTITTGFAGAFGSPTPAAQPSSSSVFGQPATGSIFGSKSPFGGTPAFGSTTTFGATNTQASASSVFGTSNFMGASPAGAQPESIFGGSSFSGLGGKPATDAANRNVFGGSSTFGATPATGIFGGTGSGQLGAGGASTGAGAFSSGGGVVAQTGFGSPTAKPANPAFGATPAFGSAPAFGSTPFGPAFGSTGSPSSTFGSGTGAPGSIFGGGNQNSGPTFGALAQSTSPPSFAGFGTPAPSTPFGQPQQQQQQQQQTSSYGGGSSFSSWR